MTGQPFIDRRAIAYAAEARPATLVDINDAEPQLVEADGSPTWLIRAANFIVAITRAKAGTRLARVGHLDEYMTFSLQPIDVSAGSERLMTEPDALTILPPGDSAIVAQGEGDIFRIFSSRATDLLAQSANAAAYADGHAEVAPLVDWPEPPEGWRIRSYPLAGVTSGDVFGRIYRSTNLMVNLFDPYPGSRDQAALSPHHHDDFEQGSLTITGDFEHYLRTPWGKDRGAWRGDQVLACASPSLTVIPAGVIHTTAWFGSGGRMIDIFAPPRADFSRNPGWVRNAADYPAPEWIK